MSQGERRDGLLTALIFAGMFLAILVGGVARVSPMIAGLIPWFAWIGVLFKQLLLMIIYPLVLAAMVGGVVNLGDVRKVGGLAAKGIGYFAGTTAISVVIGLALVNVVRPGDGVDLGAEARPTLAVESAGDFAMEMLKNTFKNPFDSMAGGDVLALIAFGMLLGAAISTLGEEGEPAARFFKSLEAAMMRLTDWIMWLAPLGVFALLSQVIADQGMDALSSLAAYAGVVVGGLALHGLVVLPLLAWGLGGIAPWAFFKGMAKPMAVAFSTASSAATLPITMEAAEHELGVRERIAGFVLPLGATINMDGTALYEAVAAMFIAQAYGIELGAGDQVLVFLTATTAAVGAAGIPGAGLVTMSLVLTAVGLPLEGVGLILAIDRALDMCRTTVNVCGDATGAVILDRWSR